MLKMQVFLCNGDQHIGAHRNPDLRLYGVLAAAQKRLDTQVLLDPLEDQFDLPTLSVQRGDQLGLEREVVGQKHYPLSGLFTHHHPTQGGGVVLAGIENRQHSGLVARHRHAAAIHRLGVAPLELGVALGTGHKEGLCLVNDKQTREEQIAPIQKIERALLDDQIAQDVDLVRFAIGGVNETGDGATQVQQRVQFDGGFGSMKGCPWQHRQAQACGGVERVVRGDSQRLLGVQGAGYGDEVLRQVSVDLPWSGGVRVGQRVARCRPAAKAHVVQPSGLGSQIDLDTAQRFASGQLGKRHDQKLIQVGEIIDLVLAAMRGQMCSAAGMP